MARYEIGIRSTNVTIANAMAEFRAVRRCDVLSCEIYLVTGTACTVGLGRPANTPAGGTIQLGQAYDGVGAPTTTSGLVISSQTTAPTVPGQFFKRINFPAAVGAGIIWTWEPGELAVNTGASLVLWNITATVTCDINFKFDD